VRAPETLDHFQRDPDGTLQDPLAPVPWDPAWDSWADQPLPGLAVFGPVTRADRTPHDGERGIEQALHELLWSERRRRAGWSMLWIEDRGRTGRCAAIQLRAWDDEGGQRALATLEAALGRLGFRVSRLRPTPVDLAREHRRERIA
jgi:hypothetical protein